MDEGQRVSYSMMFTGAAPAPHNRRCELSRSGEQGAIMKRLFFNIYLSRMVGVEFQIACNKREKYNRSRRGYRMNISHTMNIIMIN